MGIESGSRVGFLNGIASTPRNLLKMFFVIPERIRNSAAVASCLTHATEKQHLRNPHCHDML